MKKPHCVVLTHQLIRTVAKPVPKGETATVRLRVLAVRAIIGSVRNASPGAVGCPPRAAPAAGRLVGAGRAPAVARRRCRMRRERAGCRGRRTVCGERWRCVRKSAGSSSPDGRTGLSRSGFGCRDNRRSGLRQLDPDGGGDSMRTGDPARSDAKHPGASSRTGSGGVPCVERQLWCGGLPRRGGRPDFPENGSDTGLVGASRTASRPSAPEARYRNMPV